LTFEIYGDPECTDLVMSRGAQVEDLIIERLRHFRAPGAKLPKPTARINFVVTDFAESAAYLKVTGTGVLPAGAGCQFQAALDRAGASLPCARQTGNDVYFDGCNVHVRSGSGATDGQINGLGNLIIGYNKAVVVVAQTISLLEKPNVWSRGLVGKTKHALRGDNRWQ
jgi:hypothetical protein